MNYLAEVLKKFNTANRNSNGSKKRKFESMGRLENHEDLHEEIYLPPELKRFKGESNFVHNSQHTAVKSSWSDWIRQGAGKIAFWRKAANSVVKAKSTCTTEMSRNRNWAVVNYPVKNCKDARSLKPLHDYQSEVFNPFIGELKKGVTSQINIPFIDLESEDENKEGKFKDKRRNKGEIPSRRQKSRNKSKTNTFLSLSKSSPSRIDKKSKNICVKARRLSTRSPYSSSRESFQLQEREFYRLLLESQGKPSLQTEKDQGLNSISVQTQTQGGKNGAFFKVNVTDSDKLNALNRRIVKHRTIEKSPWDVKLSENQEVFNAPVSRVPVPTLKTSFHSSSLMKGNIRSHSLHSNSSLEHLSRTEPIRSNATFFGQTEYPSPPESIEYLSSTDSIQNRVPRFDPASKFASARSNSEGRSMGYTPSLRLMHHSSLQRSQSVRILNADKDLFSDEWLQDLKQEVDKSRRVNHEKVDDEEKRFQALQDEKLKKMFEANRKSIENIESKFTTLYLNKYIDSEVEEDDDYQLPPLTPDMEAEIDKATQPNPASEVLTQGFGINITRKDIETLAGLNWLNDEIINFYTNLLMKRGEDKGYPTCYTFNTFFYPKLISSGHNALKRWTRRVDVFSYDLLLVPVHLGMHWCLAVIDFRHKKIQYYDSMGGINNDCLNALKSYLVEESRDKRKIEFDMTDWKFEAVKNIPQQMNGSDCGMFTCKYAEYITRNAKITFTQRNMPYFRRRMVFEIIKKKLL